MNLWFGKHNGKQLSEVPDDYLAWLADGAMPPRQKRSASQEEKKEVRMRWMNLLSEVEDEINEREDDNHS